MPNRFVSSLRFRLSLIVAFAIIPVLLLLLHICMKDRSRQIVQARYHALQLARQIAQFQDEAIDQASSMLSTLSFPLRSEGGEDQQLSALFARLIKQSEGYAELSAASPTGRLIASSSLLKGPVSVADSPWYRRVVKTHHIVNSGYFIDPVSGRPVIVVARPVLNASGRLVVTLIAGLDLDYLNHYLTESFYPPGTVVDVIDKNGIVLGHYPESPQAIGKPLQQAPILKIVHRMKEGTSEVTEADGVSRIFGFSPMKNGNNEEYIVVGIPKALALAGPNRDLVRNLAVLLLVTLVALMAAWFVGDIYIVRKVRDLLNVIGEVTGGDLAARTGITRPHGELNQLAGAFDRMADTLQRREKEMQRLADEKLQQSQETYQLHFENVSDVIFSLDPHLVVTSISPSVGKSLGFQPQEIVGRRFLDLNLLSPASRDEAVADAMLQFAGEKPARSVYEFIAKDGTARFGEISGSPVLRDGRVVALVCVARDITEKIRIERDLDRSNRALRVLSRGNETLVRAQKESDLLENICRVVVETGGYLMAWVGYAEHDEHKQIRPVAKWGYDEGYVDGLELSWGDAPQGGGPAGTSIRTGQAAIARDIATDSGCILYRDAALQRGYASCVSLPLKVDGKAFGMLAIYAREAGAFDTEEGKLLGELANDLAYGIQALRTREEHRKTTEALRASELRFRKLYEEAPIAYESVDAKGRILAVNNKWLETFGYSKDEVIGAPLDKFLGPSLRNVFVDRLESYIACGGIYGVTSQRIRKDGSPIKVEMDGSLAYDEQGRFKQTHCVLRDVTEVKEAEQAIQTLVESSVVITGSDYFDKIVQKLCQWLGTECAVVGEIAGDSRIRVISMQVDGKLIRPREETQFETLCGTMCEGTYCVYQEGVQKLFPQHQDLANLRAEGYLGANLRDRNGRIVGVLAAISRHKLNLPRRAGDVLSILAGKTASELERLQTETETARMESQLRQAQKMESIGTLAGGIAHDFNNLLGIILGYSEIGLLDVEEGSRLYSYLQDVLRAGLRARELVKQILTFSRKSELELKPLHLAPIVKECLKLLRSALPATIDIQETVDSTQDVILGDPSQIHQVLMNLCTNAGQAMGERDGQLQVDLRTVSFRLDDSSRPAELGPGLYVQVTVKDTGPGMADAVKERIFEPYFTTKEAGKGTGLGLSVVHGIVKSAGGAITVESSPRIGTTFRVFFPALKKQSRLDREADLILSRGNETILLVDDEKSLLESTRRMLEHLGYRVISRTSGSEALEVFRTDPEVVDLLITDQIMPHLTGTSLAREVQAIRPDVPIILCSGFSENATPERIKDFGIDGLMMKPLILSDLAATVRRVLDRYQKRSGLASSVVAPSMPSADIS